VRSVLVTKIMFKLFFKNVIFILFIS